MNQTLISMIKKFQVIKGMNLERRDRKGGKKKGNRERFQMTKLFLIKNKHCKSKLVKSCIL